MLTFYTTTMSSSDVHWALRTVDGSVLVESPTYSKWSFYNEVNECMPAPGTYALAVQATNCNGWDSGFVEIYVAGLFNGPEYVGMSGGPAQGECEMGVEISFDLEANPNPSPPPPPSPSPPEPSPPPPPPPSPSPPAPVTHGYSCTNTCMYSVDDDCDDGGPGASYTLCTIGTDCVDCGSREAHPPPPSAPTCLAATDVILVVDESGSMYSYADQVREFATSIVGQFALGDGPSAGARIAVVAFASSVDILSPLTSSGQSLDAAIATYSPAGQTGISAALEASQAMLEAAAQERPGAHTCACPFLHIHARARSH